MSMNITNSAIKKGETLIDTAMAVSINVSPFLIAEFVMFIDITSAPNLLPANSKELF